MKSLRQPTTNQVRFAGEISFTRVAATAATRQIANRVGLESLSTEPCSHGYRDPRKHPGQGDV